MSVKVNCKFCGKEHNIAKSRLKSYKTCSIKCSSEYKKSLTPKNCTCKNCGKDFHLRESSIKRYNRTMGIFCSTKCSTNYKKDFYKGINNPNYRGAQYDHSGYRINHYPKVGRIKEHHFVTFNILGINKVPDNYSVHHRDCNIYNNLPENLAILKNSDHRWLHKQYGNATLWAYCNNLVSLSDLISWSNDPERAKKLLVSSILNIEFEEAQELSETQRSSGGFGSTGK